MNMLLIILGILAGLVILLLLAALIIKKEFTLEKQIIIDKPKNIVFNYLKLIKNQEHYSVWVMKDPDVKIIYTGIDGTIGFTSSWTSNDKNVGIGEQEIIKLHDGETMDVEVRFKKPFEATNYAKTLVTSITDSQIKVATIFSGKQKFPLNIMNAMMDKLIGKDMQQNLANMKTILER